MKSWVYVTAACIGVLFCTHFAFGASSEMEILLKILQDKGILSAKEAEEITKETKKAAAEQKAQEVNEVVKEATKGMQLPDWVKNSKFKGDLRLRYEARDREGDVRGTQGRGRFRLRAGMETAITDQVTAGFGLASGTGDLRTANQTLGGTFSRKNVWIDLAYARYAPTKWFSVIGGKFANPVWQPSDMLMSTDINPEGAAIKLESQVTPCVNLSFNGALFVLDDRNSNSTSTADPLMYVFQPGVKWNVTKDTFFRFAPAYYGFSDLKNTSVLTPPNTTLSSTNTATKGGLYKYNYSAINWGGDIGFSQPFGISAIPYFGIIGGYIHNPDPPDNNEGYLAGFFAGYADIRKLGDWSLEYTIRRLEKDAWIDLFPDTVFYKGNTNVMGHRVKFLFGLTKNTSFGLNYYNTWKLRNFNPTSSTTIPKATRALSSEENLFQADLTVKF